MEDISYYDNIIICNTNLIDIFYHMCVKYGNLAVSIKCNPIIWQLTNLLCRLVFKPT